MARYILIDDFSGYIMADTANLKGWAHVEQTPCEAARLLDESIQAFDRTYEEHGSGYRTHGQSAYHVYRADIEGSEAVRVVEDGMNQDTIDEVERLCRKVAVVTIAEGDIP